MASKTSTVPAPTPDKTKAELLDKVPDIVNTASKLGVVLDAQSIIEAASKRGFNIIERMIELLDEGDLSDRDRMNAYLTLMKFLVPVKQQVSGDKDNPLQVQLARLPDSVLEKEIARMQAVRSGELTRQELEACDE